MRRRMMVVGDVHGSYEQLALLLQSPYTDGRHVVFIGDLIDRGPESSKVLDFVAEVSSEWPEGATILRGNHEQDLLDFIDSGQPGRFLHNGGLSTIASYYQSVPINVLRSFPHDFPEDHLSMLRSSTTYIETDSMLISHMGYDPTRPSVRDLDAMVLQPHYELFHSGPPSLAKLTICGHYAQRAGRPYVSSALICVDTGCGTVPGAPLTAVLLPERVIVQANDQGEVIDRAFETA